MIRAAIMSVLTASQRLQSSLDGETWVDVDHISVDLAALEPQVDYDGTTFASPRFVDLAAPVAPSVLLSDNRSKPQVGGREHVQRAARAPPPAGLPRQLPEWQLLPQCPRAHGGQRLLRRD